MTPNWTLFAIPLWGQLVHARPRLIYKGLQSIDLPHFFSIAHPLRSPADL